MIKICIDAGHYGYYNKSTVVTPTYWESKMTWKLHLLLNEALEQYAGVEIRTTRADQAKDLGVYERGLAAKGCDLFLSLHSNDCSTPSVDRAEVIYPVSGKCRDLAAELVACIAACMQTNDPTKIFCKWNSSHTADYYGVIRGAAAVGVPGLILEHSFHSNARAAKWLQSDANLAKLAKAEAAVIAAYYELKPKAPMLPVLTDDFKQQMKIYRAQLQDNDAGSWSAEARQWAIDNGLIVGSGTLPDGSPNYAWQDFVTREQLVTILYRQAQTANRNQDA